MVNDLPRYMIFPPCLTWHRSSSEMLRLLRIISTCSSLLKSWIKQSTDPMLPRTDILLVLTLKAWLIPISWYREVKLEKTSVYYSSTLFSKRIISVVCFSFLKFLTHSCISDPVDYMRSLGCASFTWLEVQLLVLNDSLSSLISFKVKGGLMLLWLLVPSYYNLEFHHSCN